MKIVFTIILSLFICSAFGQDNSEVEPKFAGEWFGYILSETGDTTNYLKLRIEYDGAYYLPYSYYYDSDNSEWVEQVFEYEDFVPVRNNAIYHWMNYGGEWSESQSYHLSMVNDDLLEMLWLRQVNNVKDGNNEVWNVSGSGQLKREGSENVYSDVFIGGKSNQNIEIDKIELTDDYTIITFIYNNKNESGITITLYEPGTNGAFYITSSDRTSKYKIIDKDGIPYYPGEKSLASGESTTFSVYFERIPDDLKVITILEGLPDYQTGSEWNFYDVRLSN